METKTEAKTAGFTLVEILIALVILSVALAGMIPVLMHALRGNSYAEMTTLAGTFSQDKLEELRRAPFADIVPGTDTPATGLSRAWTVDDGTGGSLCSQCTDNVVGIEVATQWTDQHGVVHVARFFTMRADI